MVTTPNLCAELFARSKELAEQWEKPHFCLAKYLDRLMGEARDRQTAAQVPPPPPLHPETQPLSSCTATHCVSLRAAHLRFCGFFEIRGFCAV